MLDAYLTVGISVLLYVFLVLNVASPFRLIYIDFCANTIQYSVWRLLRLVLATVLFSTLVVLLWPGVVVMEVLDPTELTGSDAPYE